MRSFMSSHPEMKEKSDNAEQVSELLETFGKNFLKGVNSFNTYVRLQDTHIGRALI